VIISFTIIMFINMMIHDNKHQLSSFLRGCYLKDVLVTVVIAIYCVLMISCISTQTNNKTTIETNNKKIMSADSTAVSEFENRIKQNPVMHMEEVDQPGEEAGPLMKLLYTYHRDGYVLIDRTKSIVEKEEKTGGMGLATQSVRYYLDSLPSQETIIQQSPDLLNAIHEINHGYTDLFASNFIPHQHRAPVSWRYRSYFITREKTVIMRVLNADEMPFYSVLQNVIPSDLQTKRFSEYVSGDEGSKTGIYTLLDEYNAYYQTFRLTHALYPYFIEERPHDNSNWLKWGGKLYNDYFAYYEFRYWILTYLLHMKRIKPEQYNNIVSNKGFRIAFTWIDEDYTALVKSFDKTVEKLVLFVQKQGSDAAYVSATQEDPWKGMLLTIGDYGIEFDMIERYLLEPQFKNPEYSKLLGILHNPIE
jgi:hypothetical protein